MRFSEPVIPISVRLLDAQGAEISGMSLEPRGETLILRPAGSLQQGAYLLSYRVTSLDGHPVGAAIRFGIGVPSLRPGLGAEGAPLGVGGGALAHLRDRARRGRPRLVHRHRASAGAGAARRVPHRMLAALAPL